MAKDLNSCSFIGHAGSDAEVRVMPNGNSVANVSIAVGDQYNDKQGQKVEKTTWVRLTAYGKLAEIFGRYIVKGKQIYVEGRLDISEYADKQTGEKKYSTQIIVNNMQLLGGGSDNARSQSTQAAGGATKYAPSAPEADDFADSDIPF